MVPTLSGRLQTRTFLTFVVGLPWTLLVTLVLPRPSGAGLGQLYKTTLVTLVILWLLGILFWELLYHGLMQFRWEKDWPTLFGLILVVPEGLLTYFLVFKLLDLVDTPPTTTFLLHLLTTWFVMWCVANGPLRVLFLRWRFRGGEIIGWL
jgi:hypothetical protein